VLQLQVIIIIILIHSAPTSVTGVLESAEMNEFLAEFNKLRVNGFR
jgi:hypothetical protein